MTRKSIRSIIEGQLNASRYSRNRHELYIFLSDYAHDFSRTHGEIQFDFQSMETHMSKLAAKGQWVNNGILDKASSIYRFHQDKSFMQWMIPRLLGVHFFSLARFLQLSLKSFNSSLRGG